MNAKLAKAMRKAAKAVAAQSVAAHRGPGAAKQIYRELKRNTKKGAP